MYYKLSGHEVVPCPMEEWAAEFSNTDKRKIVSTDFEEGVTVSTVFLGMDHRFGGDGPPIIFETMIFCKDGILHELDQQMWRYCTWDEAEEGHRKVLSTVQKALEDSIPTISMDEFEKEL